MNLVCRVWRKRIRTYTGTVTVIQRFDSALRLNVHFHTLELDGVYVKSDNGERLRFLRLPRPSADDVYEVAMRTAKKVQANWEKRGRTSDSESNGDGMRIPRQTQCSFRYSESSSTSQKST